jgi:dTMP kinase
MSKGRFITFEGGEGAGKSTQVGRLAAALREAGHDVLETREPGGSPAAEEIRELLVHGEVTRWDGVTEALLHFAARREHLVQTVWPALESGQWVLCDRFADSTMAYQGYGHGLGRESIETLYDLVVGQFHPDITMILDLPVEEGLRRAAQRRDGATRYERMDTAFHERLREGFKDIARREPERCVLIDASRPVEQVQGDIRRVLTSRTGVELP